MFVSTADRAPRHAPSRVAIRCCPTTKAERIVNVAGCELSLQRPKTTLTKTFKFAHVYDTAAGNGDVHENSVSEHVRAAVSAGESVTVMSFGARATGKTATMRSRDGVVIRAATDVFAGLGVGDAYMVTVQCLISAVAPPAQSHLTGRQVTHEILLDGMLPQGEVGDYKGGLKVREHPTKGFFVEGLSEIAVDSLTECEHYLRRAIANCAAEEERCGSGSFGAPLRVHCLFTLRVRRKSNEGESVSDVQILDFAGWVRDKPLKGPGASKAPAAVGEDMVVKAFQRIVSSLEAKAGHIPYRDSKMTRLLQPALGGHAMCIPLVHVAVDVYEETEAMLSFASKLASVTCKVHPKLVDYDAELAAKQSRIEVLCRKLGRRPQGLTSADIILGMNSSEDLLELRDTLAALELQQRDGHEWAKAAEFSRAFKADDGAAATAARADRKPKKEPRFQEIEEVEQPEQRRLPPARGHGNNTPRGDKAMAADHQEGGLGQGDEGGATAGDRSRMGVLERGKAKGQHAHPAGGNAAAPPQRPCPVGGDREQQGSGVSQTAGQSDIEAITARLAKMQQAKTPTRVKEATGGSDACGRAPAPADMAERLAMLRQAKAPTSRLRNMGIKS